MLRVAEVVLVLLSPTLIAAAVLQSGRLARAVAARRSVIRPTPTTAPLESLAADARRLRQAVIAAENGPDTTPGRGTRVRALRTAYAECLRDACHALDVPVAAADLRGAELYRVEAELRDRGLDVAPARAR